MDGVSSPEQSVTSFRSGGIWHPVDDTEAREDAAGSLGVYPVAQATAHDAESGIPIIPLPHTSAAALVTIGSEHGEGSQVNEAKSSSEHAALSGLAVYPVAQATVHDAESAISVTALPHTSAAALVTVGNPQW